MGVIAGLLLPAIIMIVIVVSLDAIVYAVLSFIRWMRNLFEVDL